MKKYILYLVVGCLFLLSIGYIVKINYFNEKKASDYSDYKKEVYSVYSKIYLTRNTIKKTEKISGFVRKTKPTYYKEIQFSGTKQNIKKKQGEKFNKGDYIYITNTKAYIAEFNGIVERVSKINNKYKMVLANYDDRIVETEVPIELLKYVKLNKKIHFEYGKKRYSGKIAYISSVASENRASVEIKFNDKEKNILTDAEVNVIIVKAIAKNVISVPKDALVKNGSEYYIRTDNGTDEGELKKVQVGIESDDGEIEIKSGIKDSDIVMKNIDDNTYEE
ncbi:MAG: hypothetical protein UCH84_03865 [Eubacterium sp.]|nr:hypothetical protein [Eubacterium sp.]